ncbi:MAG: hypothetical protein KDC46_12455 [Thermoleophilia bacterium]|nr:hypothetical protein [Thermoleophilia bacterium]
MAQRNSRKGGGKTKKRPELRTGGGRKAKAERAEERDRHRERTASGAAPVVRMRPSGAGGMLVVQLVAWLGVALLAYVGHRLERWGQLSYPDSLWLYVSFGVVAVAAAVGRVSRTVRDADAWGVEALLVPGLVFAATAISGPGCPTGGDCASIGARGSMGLFWSLVVIAAAAVAAWGIARWQFRAAMKNRPGRGRVRYGTAIVTMLWLLVFPGIVFGGSLLALDLWLRDTPDLVQQAKVEAERECYGLAAAPELAVRPSPDGYNPAWTTFAVRRADESRPGVGKKQLPSDWANLDYVHPYEATVTFDATGQLVEVTCNRLGPKSGNATADDLTSTPPDTNPLSPKTTGSQFLPRFFTQGVAGPTEEGKKLAAKQAKQAKAAAKQSSDSKATTK